jgi:hypothetical protein
LEAYLEIEKGHIISCRFRGDFLGLTDTADVEQALTGARYTAADLRSALERIDIQLHFGSITLEEVIACLLGSA